MERTDEMNAASESCPVTVDDQAVLERARQGDLQAFQELVERYKRTVYYTALDFTGRAEDAEDISQDVFIKAYQSLRDFRGDAKVSSWFYRITINTCIDERRKKINRLRPISRDTEESGQWDIADENANPQKDFESSRIQADIEQALGVLSPQERAVFILRHYNELMLKEIGETLNISEGTVKSVLFRAVRKLRKVLDVYRPAGMENEDVSM